MRAHPYLLSILVLAGVACGGVRPEAPAPPAATAPAGTPSAGVNYDIVAAQSELRVLVYRDGTLARLGHNHVIASRDLSGSLTLAEPLVASSALMTVPLSTLIIDDPAMRLEQGAAFASDVSDKDREGTRKNMLGERLLDAAHSPSIEVHVVEVSGEPPALNLTANVTVRGEAHRIVFPAAVRIDGQRVTVNGETTITHAQLGLTPFSVMLGALRVRDEITLRYRIVADRR